MQKQFDSKAEAEAGLIEYLYSIRNKTTYHDFSGHNCHYFLPESEECRGWDGSDKRCECGNRRVDWEIVKDYNGKWICNAEAY